MAIQRLGSVDVQYVSSYFTRKMEVLFGDRRSRMNPILSVLLDDVTQEIIFEISNVRVDAQRRNNVREGLDLYLVKSEVTILNHYLNSILGSIAAVVTLDTSQRLSTDPRYTYNQATQGGLEIPIQQLEGWVKVNEVVAEYGSNSYRGKITRTSTLTNNPLINIEMEHKAFWDQPRMHIGIHEDWIEENLVEPTTDKIIIRIPWVELAQLIGRITAVEANL